jgi:hypothetical protein
VTWPFVCDAADVEEPPLERAWRAAQEERPWEPPGGWDALLARRRHALVRDVVLTASVWPAVVLVIGALRDHWGRALFWCALTLLYAARSSLPLFRPASRAAWETDLRRRARLEHALEHHASVGAEFRGEVTERAEEVRSMASVGLLLWPCLALVLLAVAVTADGVGIRVVSVAGAGLVLAALVRSRRRAALARRWLDDPLPRR